jgi:hypothetical protein
MRGDEWVRTLMKSDEKCLGVSVRFKPVLDPFTSIYTIFVDDSSACEL